MAATKTDKGSRQDMFASSVNSVMTGQKPEAAKTAVSAPKASTNERPVEKKIVQEPVQEQAKPVEKPAEKAVPVKKKSAGRPKGVEKTQISLYIPNDLLAKMECATYFYRGNATAYITALIEKDMEDNKEKYNTIRSAMGM